jgi:uncharacterized membrane protein
MKHNPFTHPAARPTNTWRQTIIYYSLHISMAAAIGFAITDSWGVALAVSMIEPAVQVLAWLTQQWEQRVQNHSIQQSEQSLAIQRYLARYARAA